MENLFFAFKNKFNEKYNKDISEYYQEFNDISNYIHKQYTLRDKSPTFEEFQKELIKQAWKHFENKVKNDDKIMMNINTSKFIDGYNNYRDSQSNALKGLYQNTRYGFEREEMKSLIIDVIDIATAGGSFTVDFDEPIIIDKLYNVYLDTVSIYNGSVKTSGAVNHFIIGLDEIKINNFYGCSSSNTLNANNKIIVPNDITTSTTSTVLKSKKFNFIGQINPKKLTSMSGSIFGTTTNSSDLAGTKFAGSSNRLTIELLLVAAEKMSWK